MLHLPTRPASRRVVLATAAGSAVPRAPAHHLWTATRLTAAVHHVHLRVPEPRPTHPRREAVYFEAARMSREMDHL